MDNVMKTISSASFVSGVEAFHGHAKAIMGSSHIWTAGCQSIGHAMVATAHAHVERTMSMWKSLSGLKSFKQAMDLHTSFAHSSMEIVAAEAGKLADTSMRLAEQAMAPITARMTLAIGKLSHSASSASTSLSI